MFVTDTHPLIWYSNGKHSKLTSRVLSVFDECVAGHRAIYVPTMVLFEIALLNEKGKIALKESFAQWVTNLTSSGNFILSELDTATIGLAVGYRFNEDPFDRAIVATAANMDLPLITKDSSIVDAQLVEIFW